MAKEEKKKSNLLTLFLLLVVVGAVGYFYSIQPSSKEKYKVKSAGGESGYKASFINVTGKDADDKKIGLSDDYWTSGKFK